MKKHKKHEKSIRIVIKTSIYDESFLFTFRKEWVGLFVMIYTTRKAIEFKNVYI